MKAGNIDLLTLDGICSENVNECESILIGSDSTMAGASKRNVCKHVCTLLALFNFKFNHQLQPLPLFSFHSHPFQHHVHPSHLPPHDCSVGMCMCIYAYPFFFALGSSR